MSESISDVPAVVEQEQFPLNHLGFGRYEVDGAKYPSKEAALRAQASLIARKEAEDSIYGDLIPEGFDFKVTDRSLVFRGSVLEVPMNEVYLPDGDFNPMYDRMYFYAWAARRARSISSYEAVGYKKFLYSELEAMVEEGAAPAHYLSLLQRDGDFLVYGDLLLMRTPRVLWRQRKEAQAKRAKALQESGQQLSDSDTDKLGLPREVVGPD